MVHENVLLNRVNKYFMGNKFHTCREVPLLSNRIDLVAYNSNLSNLIAVEVKVMDWKRAVQQALLYRLCAHQVYIAIWHKFLHRVEIRPLEELGIGVLSVDGHAEVVMKPKPSQVIHKSLMQNVKKYIISTRRDNG